MKIEQVSLWVSIIGGICSIVIALFYGSWGIRLSNKQIEIAEQANRTSLDIQHFNQLLYKTDELLYKQSALIDSSSKQITSLTVLNKTLSNELDLLNNQYRLNLSVFKQNKIDFIHKKIQDYQKVLVFSGKLGWISSRSPRLCE